MEEARPWRSLRVIAPIWLMVASMLLGATGAVAFDVGRWRDAGSAARSVASSSAASVHEQIEAMVAMRRDICASLAILQSKAAGTGELAETAQNALRMIDAARQR